VHANDHLVFASKCRTQRNDTLHEQKGIRGSDSWADTLADVGRTEFFTGSGGAAGTNIAGIDSVTVVPEPTTVLLLATGMAGLAAAGRRRSPQ
jgi:hypothetical protein